MWINFKYIKKIKMKNIEEQCIEQNSPVIKKDCWICYDNETKNTGSLIKPCNCRGDVSVVHHDCLRRWLIESCINEDLQNLTCKVCGCIYNVEHSTKLNWNDGFNRQHWIGIIYIVMVIIISSLAAWFINQIVEIRAIRILVVGTAVLVIYVCLKCLSLHTVKIYNRAKINSLKIFNNDSNLEDNKLTKNNSCNIDLTILEFNNIISK